MVWHFCLFDEALFSKLQTRSWRQSIETNKIMRKKTSIPFTCSSSVNLLTIGGHKRWIMGRSWSSDWLMAWTPMSIVSSTKRRSHGDFDDRKCTHFSSTYITKSNPCRFHIQFILDSLEEFINYRSFHTICNKTIFPNPNATILIY